MRSITAKAICTLLVTAMIFVLAYFVMGVIPAADLFNPTTGTVPSSDPPTIPPTTSTVPPTTLPPHQHSFGEAWQSDESAHWNQCSCGEKANLSGHTDADYDEACDTCGAFVLHEHTFSSDWSSDGENHWYQCPCGEQINVTAHVDNDFDEVCDICQGQFLHVHSFGETWYNDYGESPNHWNECPCGEKANIAQHTDTDYDEACDVCDCYVQHIHVYDGPWESDEAEHWQCCGCGDMSDSDYHTDEDFDELCDVCAADVPHEHSFGAEWESDETNHWNLCPCGVQGNLSAHTDEDFDEACDTCTAFVPHTHSFSEEWKSDETGHWNPCICSYQGNLAPHSDAAGDGICDICAYVIFTLEPPTLPQLNGKHAFIFECDDNSYLYKSFESNGTSVYPASITKVFACWVAMNYLTADEQILLGDEQSFFPSDSSIAGFYAGQTVSVDALLHGSLMASGADATYALAAAAGRKILNDPNADARAAVDAFVAEMNRQSNRLGMAPSNFVTPDGYHNSQHVVSLHAFVIIARCALDNPDILAVCNKYTATVTYRNSSGQTLSKTFTSTNALINPNSSYYIPEAIGLKTGYTSKAGNCFLGLFYHDGKYVIIGIMGCPSGTGRWQDMNELWDYYLKYCAYESLT